MLPRASTQEGGGSLAGFMGRLDWLAGREDAFPSGDLSSSFPACLLLVVLPSLILFSC